MRENGGIGRKAALAALLALVALAAAFGQGQAKLKKAYKIGVILYDYADDQGKELKRYCSYLEKEFKVKFVYAVAAPEEAQEIKAVEDLCAAGVDAIMDAMWTKKAMQVAAENKVYLGVLFNDVLGKAAGPGDQGYDEVKANPYYVGAVASGRIDASYIGPFVAKLAADRGLDDYGIVGFPRFWLPKLDMIGEGFSAAAKKLGKTVINGNPASTFGPDDVMRLNPMGDVAAQLSTYLSAHPEMQFLFATASGMNLVYPTVVNMGLKGKVKLATVDYSMQATEPALADGSLVFTTAGITQVPIGILFALLVDKLEGKSFADAPKEAQNLEAQYAMIKSVEEYRAFKRLVLGDVHPLTAADLRRAMKTFNPGATFAGLKQLALDSADLAKLAAKKR